MFVCNLVRYLNSCNNIEQINRNRPFIILPEPTTINEKRECIDLGDLNDAKS